MNDREHKEPVINTVMFTGVINHMVRCSSTCSMITWSHTKGKDMVI